MKPIEEAFLDVAHAVKKDPAWVIQDFIPVGLTFLAGPPKVSHKSTLSMVIACLCARWECRALPSWMDCTLGGPTMLFSYEADAGEVRSIIEDGLQVDVQPGALYIASDPWSFQLDVGNGPDALVEYLDIKQPRLVIMDPFRNMWSGDENDSGAIIKVLGPMQRWLKANEAAGIVVHHVNKPQASSNPQDPGAMFSMRGSSAIPGLADGIVVIEPTRHEGQITIHTRFKRGPSWKRTLQLGVPGFGWPAQGYELIPELARSVLDGWQGAKVHDLDWLAQAGSHNKQPVQSIKAQLATLHRNALISMSKQEQAWFLPTF
jgi:hypothetical protein